MTPTPEDQTTASGSSMSDEVPTVLLGEESTSALPIPLTRSSPDHAFENNLEKIITGSSTTADDLFSPASTLNSVLDNSTSLLPHQVRFRFFGKPVQLQKLGGADEYDDNAQTIPSKKVKIDWSHSGCTKNGCFKICISSLTEKNN